MGFARKALFVSTGGLSGAVGIKANSKKERAAKAAEKQLKVQRQMAKDQRRESGTTVAQHGASAASEIERLGDLHHQGLLTDEEFATAKMQLLSPGS